MQTQEVTPIPKTQSARNAKGLKTTKPNRNGKHSEDASDWQEAEGAEGARVLGEKLLVEYTDEDWQQARVDTQRDGGQLPTLALTWLNPKLIREDPENERGPVTRECDPDLPALADSIQQRGVLEPLLVYRAGDDIILQSGHRRKAAAILAGLALVPCVIKPAPKGPLDQAIDRLTSNLQRRDLSPIEKAKSLRAMIEANPLTQASLAKRLGMSQGAIGNLLRILDLTQSVQTLVAEGKLTTGHAVALLSVKEPSVDWQGNQTAEVTEVVEAFAKHAVDSSWSVRDTESRCKNHNQNQASSRRYREENAQREAERQAQAQQALGLESGVELTEYDAAVKQYQEELGKWGEMEVQLRLQRSKVGKDILQGFVAWDQPEGPTLDHLRMVAMMVGDQAGVYEEKRKAKLNERIEKARSQLEILNIMAELAVGGMGLDYEALKPANYGRTAWAAGRFNLNEKLLAEWEARGLLPPPRPVEPEPPKEVLAAKAS